MKFGYCTWAETMGHAVSHNLFVFVFTTLTLWKDGNKDCGALQLEEFIESMLIDARSVRTI